LILCLLPNGAAHAQATASGYQVINGTQVYTVVDMGAGFATFSNACGSQRISQRDLQGGAIPDRIIPCPRGAAGFAPAVPRGRDTLSIGLGLLEAAPAVGAFLDSLSSPSGGEAAHAAAPAHAPPPPPPAMTDRTGYETRGYEPLGYDRAKPIPPSASRPRSPQALNVAVMQYDEAAESNRNRKYCDAKDLFEQAAQSFVRAGDVDRANDARFQASLTAADCVDEKRRNEDDKFATWCMNDEEDIYAGGWRPEPGAGCDPSKKPVTTGTLPPKQGSKQGSTQAPKRATPIRKDFRQRLQEMDDRAKAEQEAKRALEASMPDMTSLDETSAPPPAATSASDDFRKNFPGGQP
jgi:hypothetical protein